MSQEIAIRRANTILYCQQWEETVPFYRDGLGLPITFANDWFVEFRLTESARLSVANAERATIASVAGQGITLTCLVADLQETKRQLEAKAVATTPIRERWQARVFYCYDPEGHRIEFWAPGNGEEEKR